MACSLATPQLSLTLREMTELGSRLRKLGNGAGSMEEVAGRITHCLFEDLPGSPSVLVRMFKTHNYGELPEELQAVAKRAAGGGRLEDSTKCLTLLATAGEKPEWNDRRGSEGHQVIPLLSAEMVASAPMISRLIDQMGLDVQSVLEPGAQLLVDRENKAYNVFHVNEAKGSPYVPGQEFVACNGVKSVLGFGGVLPSGNLLAALLFTRVEIPRETAEMFRTLALSVKMAILASGCQKVFA